MSEQIVVLTVKSQKASGEKVYRLHKKRAVLGSATSNDLRLDDPSVSSVHAILEVSGVDGKPVIYDLASETGVLVNGKPTVQATLEPNDNLQIGPYLISVRVQSFEDLPKAPGYAPEKVKESFGQKLFVNEKEDLAPLILEDERGVYDIFDHRSESKQSLQVVMFFQNTILDVEHFVDKKRIMIGPGAKDDFSIPPFFGEGKQGQFELVSNEGGNFALHLHDSMDGVISSNGQMRPIREVLGSSSKVQTLVEKDFAKVKIKDVSFFLSYTAAPPKLKARRIFEKDPFFARIWFASLLLTAVILVAVSNAVVNPTIEIEQLPERVATIIYEPKLLPVERPPVPKVKEEPKIVEQKPKEEPKKIKIEVQPTKVNTPAPKNAVIAEKQPEQKKAPEKPATSLPKETKKEQSQKQMASGNEGAGEKAKGTEGSRGAKNKPEAATHQTAAQRPGEGKTKSNVAANKGNSQTNDMGVVDVFKSNQGMLNKIFAGGKGASNAANKLEGYSGFSTKGEGGLGEAGSGSGGGGKSEGLGGLADKGAGGGKRGTGLGAVGSGGNIIGGKGKLSIDSGGGSGEPVVMGAIDTDAIARAIAEHKDEIRYCYEKEINAQNPDLAGRVSVRFGIGASGTVTSAGVASTSLKNANTERCILEVIRRIPFPPVRGGGTAEVTYPFLFKPSNK